MNRLWVSAMLLVGCSATQTPSMPVQSENAPPVTEPAPTSMHGEAEAPETDQPKTNQPETDQNGCVTNPFRHAVRHLVENYADEIATETGRAPTLSDYPQPGANCSSLEPLPDLDGDGNEELELAQGCYWGTYGALHVLYFSNRGCRRFAGSLIASELVPLETQNDGVRDLESTWSNGCAGNDFTWTKYRWQGSAYRAVDNATCEFCTDAEQPQRSDRNTHPHCRSARP